jgi:hypothetical protein
MAQARPHVAVAGLDVVEGEAADCRRPLGVEQDEQSGETVLGFDGFVVQQPAGLLPAALGVDDAGGAGPFDRGEVQAGQLLLVGPANEVPGPAAVGGVPVGEPAVEVCLPAGGQGEVGGGQPVEQGGGAADVLADPTSWL